MSAMITVSLNARGRPIKNLGKTISTWKGAPVSEVLDVIAKRTKLNINRVKITNSSGKQLEPSDNITSDSTLTVKDLGPQIPWRTVFIFEYLGPIVIHPLIYSLYSNHSNAQTLYLGLVVLHYLKREYETLFVHRFSSGTMPLANLFKNCAYYWGIGSVFVGAVTYSSQYATASITGISYLMVGLYLCSEYSNYLTHLTLRDLRPQGSTTRAIPKGYGFSLVSCPNYFFEIMAWISMSYIVGSWASFVFTAVGAAQMWVWAQKKHSRYRKEFKDYPRTRKALVPFIA